MVRAVLGSVLSLVVVACAGRSISRDDGTGGSSGDDTGGSAGTTGGFGGTATTGGAGGTATTGGSGATVATGGITATGGRATGGRGGTVSAGSGGTAGICTLPPDPGPCEGLTRAYAYDVETGLCLPFIYGGCEGNPNRFATAEECYRMCEGARVGGTAYCEYSSECSRIPTQCCGCAAASFETVVGVNYEHQLVIEATKCATIDCVTCPADPALAWFGASCRENHCIAWDAREVELTLCSTSADCTLRRGLGCCQDCAGSVDALVAVNLATAGPWICPDGQPPCPACPTPQSSRVGVYAACQNGRCTVAYPR